MNLTINKKQHEIKYLASGTVHAVERKFNVSIFIIVQ